MNDGSAGPGGTILIVDDNPVNLGVVVEHLEFRGFEVAVALGGEEALDRARYLKPDLILLDVMMPGLDGFETCRRLKAAPETSMIPVIFMTALGDVGDKTQGFAAGGVDYVSKPFQVGDLLARVGTHIAIGAAHRRLRDEMEAMRTGSTETGAPGAGFRRLFETSADGILLIDASGETVIDANPAAAEMLGSDAAALIGRTVSDLPGFGPDAAEAVRRVIPARHLGLGDWRIERPEGSLSVEVVGICHRDAAGERIELSLHRREERSAA